MVLRPARLPRRSKVLGAFAIAGWALAVSLLIGDVSDGHGFLGSGTFFASMNAVLLWALADAPVRYQVENGHLHIVTRLRRIVVPFHTGVRVSGVGRDRFAINGGFGWYGWFRLDQRVVRAWVTNPDFAVLVNTGGRAVLVSPAEPERLLDSPLPPR